MQVSHPFRGDGLLTRTAPFAVLVCVAFIVAFIPTRDMNWNALLLAAIANAVIFVGASLLALLPLPAALHLMPPLAYFVVVALLRHAHGGWESAYDPFVMVPIVWIALYGSSRQLAVGIVAVFAVFSLPILFLGEMYPDSEWRRAFLWTVVAGLIGMSIRGLVMRVHSLTRIDPLTGVFNRNAITGEISREFKRAIRAKSPLTVAMFDIQGMRAINSERGFLGGDHVIRDLAQRWVSDMRETDVLVRFSGQTFLVILPECTAEQAHNVVSRMHQAAIAEGAPCTATVVEWNGTDDVDAYLNALTAALDAAKHAPSKPAAMP